MTTTEPLGTFIALRRICAPLDAWYSPDIINLFLSANCRATVRVESYNSLYIYGSANALSPIFFSRFEPNGSTTGNMIFPDDDSTVYPSI